MQCVSHRRILQASGPLTASEVKAPDQVNVKEKKDTISQYDFTLAANRHDESHVLRGHPCAGDPGRGSGFDREVSCSLEGA